jgi:hypothetical protein
MARDARAYFPSLPWVLREERGEITGKAHVHFLLGGLPLSWVTKANCFRIMWQCDLDNSEGWRIGHSRIQIFNPRLNGADYLTKCLSGMQPRTFTSSGNLVETSKS